MFENKIVYFKKINNFGHENIFIEIISFIY